MTSMQVQLDYHNLALAGTYSNYALGSLTIHGMSNDAYERLL